MDITTIAGIVATMAIMVVGIFWGGGQIMSFVDVSSVFIVFGGLICTIFTAYPMEDITGMLKVIGKTMKKGDENPKLAIEQIIKLANIARKEGLLALEEAIKDIEDLFLQKGIMLIVDGTDPDLVKDILEAEISNIESRHGKGQGMLDNLAAYGPAYGMIGTLIGLINMLKDLDDPSTLGPSMAVALITTFYGSLLANALFTPMSNKLKIRSGSEMLYKDIMLEGMLSIQAGENPRIIEEKLYSFLPRTFKSPASTSDRDAE